MQENHVLAQCRGFIKGRAPGKLTGCERDLGINLPRCFHLLFLLSFIRTKNARLENPTDLLHKNLTKPLAVYVCILCKLQTSHLYEWFTAYLRLQSMTKVLGAPGSDGMKMHWQAILETKTKWHHWNKDPPLTMLETSNDDKQRWIGGKKANWLLSLTDTANMGKHAKPLVGDCSSKLSSYTSRGLCYPPLV